MIVQPLEPASADDPDQVPLVEVPAKVSPGTLPVTKHEVAIVLRHPAAEPVVRLQIPLVDTPTPTSGMPVSIVAVSRVAVAVPAPTTFVVPVPAVGNAAIRRVNHHVTTYSSHSHPNATPHAHVHLPYSRSSRNR
jgi:hypothetical protein